MRKCSRMSAAHSTAPKSAFYCPTGGGGRFCYLWSRGEIYCRAASPKGRHIAPLGKRFLQICEFRTLSLCARRSAGHWKVDKVGPDLQTAHKKCEEFASMANLEARFLIPNWERRRVRKGGYREMLCVGKHNISFMLYNKLDGKRPKLWEYVRPLDLSLLFFHTSTIMMLLKYLKSSGHKEPDCNPKLLQIIVPNSSSAMKELVISLTFPYPSRDLSEIKSFTPRQESAGANPTAPKINLLEWLCGICLFSSPL